MENKKTEQKIKLADLKCYLSEWFFMGVTSKVKPVNYDSYNRLYQILDTYSDELLFEHLFGVDTIDMENAEVSTAGIKNQELRGLVEQSIALDNQIEFYKKRDEAQKQQSQSNKQKGE